MNLKNFKKSNLKWITLIICLGLFLFITFNVYHKSAIFVDKLVYDFLSNYIISKNITPIAKVITNFGGVSGIILLTFILGVIIKNKKIGMCIIINACIASSLNFIIKNIIQRERPIGFRLIEESGYSFPSGHSMTSMAYYGLLIYFIYKYIKSTKVKILCITAISILIICIGLSRIYLGVHYTSDVLGGFFLAISYLIVFTSFSKKYIERD